MRFVALIFLSFISVFAQFFPSQVQTTVDMADIKEITLHKPLPVAGMSGVVVHYYTTSLGAILTYIEQKADGKCRYLSVDPIKHDALPTIKTPIGKNDQVIGGYLYNNVLLIAPDAQSYSKFIAIYSKHWIHPDLYALFLQTNGENKPTRQNLQTFALQHQVGLVVVIRKNDIVLLDPISQKFISTMKSKDAPNKGEIPFFNRLDRQKAGWFDSELKESYYQIVEKL